MIEEYAEAHCTTKSTKKIEKPEQTLLDPLNRLAISKGFLFFVSFVLFVVQYSHVCSNPRLHFGCGYAALSSSCPS
jgi:hypothetical protein